MQQYSISGLGIRYYNRAGLLMPQQDTGDEWCPAGREKWAAWFNDDRTTPRGERFDQFDFYRIPPT